MWNNINFAATNTNSCQVCKVILSFLNFAIIKTIRAGVIDMYKSSNKNFIGYSVIYSVSRITKDIPVRAIVPLTIANKIGAVTNASDRIPNSLYNLLSVVDLLYTPNTIENPSPKIIPIMILIDTYIYKLYIYILPIDLQISFVN
jgi:hypothetical protein